MRSQEKPLKCRVAALHIDYIIVSDRQRTKREPAGKLCWCPKVFYQIPWCVMLFASKKCAVQTQVLMTVTQFFHVSILILQQVRHHWCLVLLRLACEPRVCVGF